MAIIIEYKNVISLLLRYQWQNTISFISREHCLSRLWVKSLYFICQRIYTTYSSEHLSPSIINDIEVIIFHQNHFMNLLHFDLIPICKEREKAASVSISLLNSLWIYVKNERYLFGPYLTFLYFILSMEHFCFLWWRHCLCNNIWSSIVSTYLAENNILIPQEFH